MDSAALALYRDVSEARGRREPDGAESQKLDK